MANATTNLGLIKPTPEEFYDINQFNENMDKIDANFYGYKRLLTSADDLNSLVENGVYVYFTSGVPQNCPYTNAGVVEVLGSNSDTSQKIQRVTRYGKAGQTAFRSLDDGAWMDWSYVAIESNVINPDPKFVRITLSSSAWTGSAAPYTYTLTGHDGKNVEVVEDVNMTMEQLTAIENAKIKSDPSSSQNILYAFGTKPTIDIPVLLIVR